MMEEIAKLYTSFFAIGWVVAYGFSIVMAVAQYELTASESSNKIKVFFWKVFPYVVSVIPASRGKDLFDDALGASFMLGMTWVLVFLARKQWQKRKRGRS